MATAADTSASCSAILTACRLDSRSYPTATNRHTPASRARRSMAGRSAANSDMKGWACESTICIKDTIVEGKSPRKTYRQRRPMVDTMSRRLAWNEACKNAIITHLEGGRARRPHEETAGGGRIAL